MANLAFNNLYEPKKASFDNMYISQDSVSIEEPKRCSRSTWKRAWIDFTESTTIHGIRHIWTADAFAFRRFVWLTLVLAGIGIMSYQIIDRIIYYRRWPANVNVDVNFNDTLPFPAITLCNQNAFRATAAAADNRYRLIEDMYTNRHNFSVDDLGTVYNASNITVDDLYFRAAHRKEDLIVSCKWGSTPCHLEDFTQIATDHGICYTFNDPLSPADELNVTNAVKLILASFPVEPGEVCLLPADGSTFIQITARFETITSRDKAECAAIVQPWTSLIKSPVVQMGFDPSYKVAHQTKGIDYGLRLVLNVEQYEYMPGPHDAAGVKIFIHDQDEFPLVGDLGLAVPTGSHSFVGNSLFVLKNLPPPHGVCGEKTMKYFPNVSYTTAICKIDCLTTELKKACGCRDAYLPHIDNNPPVCTLQQMYECAMPFIDQFHIHEHEICECPVPCTFQAYEPGISYATTSSFVIDKLLANLNYDELEQKYRHAREVTNRLEKDKFLNFKKVADNVKRKLLSIDLLLKEEIEEKLQEQRAVLAIKKEEMYKIWKRKDFILKYQLYAIQKNFLRARDAMEERTLSYIGNGFQAFALDMHTKLHELVDMESDQECTRDLLYKLLTDKVDIEVEMINRGIGNLTELIDAYKNGTPIFNYKYSKMSRKNNPYIVPKKLMNDSLYRTWNARNYGLRIASDLEILKEHVLGFKNLTEIAYYNGTLDPDRLWYVNKKFIFYNKRYFHNKANLYFESIEVPEKVMEQRIDNFTQLWTDFVDLTDNIESNIDRINASLDEVLGKVIPKLRALSDLGQEYLVNSSVLKLDVAKAALSPQIHEGINTMKVFFLEVRSRGQSIFDDWTNLIDVTSDTWRSILTDVDSIEYYQWRGYDNFLQNLSVVLDTEESHFVFIRDETDIRDLIGNRDRIFYSSLYDMMDIMGDFKKSTKLDGNFLRENFVFLDVFYSELSYEEVTQQEDYTIFSLLCDIGGSMGLFIGASAMSLFELVDLLVDQSFKQALSAGKR